MGMQDRQVYELQVTSCKLNVKCHASCVPVLSEVEGLRVPFDMTARVEPSTFNLQRATVLSTHQARQINPLRYSPSGNVSATG